MTSASLLAFIGAISPDESRVILPETLLFEEKILSSINILDLMGYVEHQLGRRLTTEELTTANFASVQIIERTFFTSHDRPT
jgi:acyl carrier protein